MGASSSSVATWFSSSLTAMVPLVDAMTARRTFFAMHAFEQLFAGHGSLAVVHEVLKQGGLGFRQLHAIAARPANFPAWQIDHPLAEIDLMDVRRLRSRPAKDRFDASQQFTSREWLDNIVVGSELEALHAIFFRATCR